MGGFVFGIHTRVVKPPATALFMPLSNLPKGEEALSELIKNKGLLVVVCGHHPFSSSAKGILTQGSVFVWETEEKNPYKALREVVYNLCDVQDFDKKGKGD